MKQLLAKLGDGAPERLNEEYRAWQRRRVNTPMLKSIGRIRKPDAEGAVNLEAVDDPAFESALGEMKRVLLGDTPGSLVLTGPAGCGKSALLHVLSNRLAAYVTGAAIVVDGGLSLTNWFEPPVLDDL